MIENKATLEAQEIAAWRAAALRDIREGPVKAFKTTFVPTRLAFRIDYALQGCLIPSDVELVFVQLQDGQLVG